MKKFRMKKSLGQHFLTDKNIAKKIVNLAHLQENENVWEIGPGRGILTNELVDQKCILTCFEIDSDLIPLLKKRFNSKVELINADILKIKWQDYLPKEKVKIVANLPYQITSPFLYKVTKKAHNFSKVVLMIQKEVAKRIAADIGSKDYGKLTLKIQFYFNVDYGFTVGPQVFKPQPKVNSAVIILRPREDKPILEDEELFWHIVKVGFRNRRKMLRRNLRMLIPKPQVEKLKSLCNIALTRRAETLSESEFIELYDGIRKLKRDNDLD